MAKISALTTLARADVLDTDYIVVVDSSAGVTKRMDIDSLLGALDGDQLDIDFTPTYYTPDAATPAEADDADDLTAHLQGIDTKLGEIDLIGTEQADTTFTISSSDHYIEIDTSGNPVTATLPSAATLGQGWHYTIKVTDATALTTIATNGAETINGVSGWQLKFKNETLSLISDGTNWKVLDWTNHLTPTRGRFKYADATSFTVTAACYELPTSAFGKVYWSGTYTLGPDTWAAGSTSIATTGWHYLYLDQSAIDAGSSPIIADSHFISSTTAPTYSTSYHGYYNGNDRCIFAYKITTASTIKEFYHSGDRFVGWAGQVVVYAVADVDTTWVDITLDVPFVGDHAEVIFALGDVSATVSNMDCYWRPNGGGDATGHNILRFNGNTSYVDSIQTNTLRVWCGETDRIIEFRMDAASTVTMGAWQSGYHLPGGF